MNEYLQIIKPLILMDMKVIFILQENNLRIKDIILLELGQLFKIINHIKTKMKR